MLTAMPQEHERSLGLWHAEWETLPELCCVVSGSLQQALAVIPGLEVDAERMLQNLDLTHGLVLAEAVSIALAQRMGRDAAHHLIEQCCRRAVEQGKHLREVLGAEPQVAEQLSAQALDNLLNPAHYLGQSKRWVKRAVADHQAFNLR
jgi:3-carboxy-cis,cis-muconate cycloisomerase